MRFGSCSGVATGAVPWHGHGLSPLYVRIRRALPRFSAEDRLTSVSVNRLLASAPDTASKRGPPLADAAIYLRIRPALPRRDLLVGVAEGEEQKRAALVGLQLRQQAGALRDRVAPLGCLRGIRPIVDWNDLARLRSADGSS